LQIIGADVNDVVQAEEGKLKVVRCMVENVLEGEVPKIQWFDRNNK
jgi:hypothetical protein